MSEKTLSKIFPWFLFIIWTLANLSFWWWKGHVWWVGLFMLIPWGIGDLIIIMLNYFLTTDIQEPNRNE